MQSNGYVLEVGTRRMLCRGYANHASLVEYFIVEVYRSNPLNKGGKKILHPTLASHPESERTISQITKRIAKVRLDSDK